MKKNILITGTSKGLGSFFVKNLKEKHNVIGISRNKSLINGFEEIIFDLLNIDKYNELFKLFEQKKYKIDILVLNAGIGFFGKFEDIDENKYIEMINTNLLSPIILLKGIEKFLTKDAKVVFIGSISSKKFFKYGSVYQASKFGLRGFAGSLKNEWKTKKIFFLNPKVLDTSFHDNSIININFSNDKFTLKEILLNGLENIIEGKENRFEIDF